MAGGEHASLTKEFPLSTSDATIAAITPNMPYSDLREFARRNTNVDAPGLLKKRILLLQNDGTIAYDQYLSLVGTEGAGSTLVRKVMYFTWAYRDDRLRRFICEVVANESGRWRISELERKSNASFFEEFLQEGPARKARSNIEYFLVEAGIFDK